MRKKAVYFLFVFLCKFISRKNEMKSFVGKLINWNYHKSIQQKKKKKMMKIVIFMMQIEKKKKKKAGMENNK